MGSQNLAIMKNLLVGTFLSTLLSVPLAQDTCLGENGDWNCCTDDNPCDIGQGDCDRDSHCKPGLKCEDNADNCKEFNPIAHPMADCCVLPDQCLGKNGDWNCCTDENPCDIGQGDCDRDSHCKPGLKCEDNMDNCRDFSPDAHPLADCCVSPGCAQCGVKQVKTKRVVGGSNTEVNEYPWMALLILRGQQWCGGSLISSKWVLSASHCLRKSTDYYKKNLKIRLGEHDLNIIDETMITKDFDIDLIVNAPNYNIPYFASNDIALIRLTSNADTSIYTPICLPTHLQDFTGQTSTVAGWGRTTEGGTSANILQELEGLPIIPDSQCKSNFATVGMEVSPDMVCAGGEEGKDSCGGDSGGPLMVHVGNSSRFTLAGVVSWGAGCARKDFPGVYAEVSKFIPWIEDTIKINGGHGETCAA